MRLYNVFYICKSALPGIKEMSISELSNDNNVVLVRNWKNCKTSLDILKSIECFDEKITALYKFLDWRATAYDGDMRLPPADRRMFEKYIFEVTYAVETLINLCDSMEMGKADSGIDVKIPKCNSLKEYMNYLKDIDFIFTQCPYLLHEKEEVRFNNVDVGSQWLTFAVVGITGSFYILNNLARIIQEVIAFKSNILICKQQEEFLKEYQQKHEIMDETIAVFKKMKQDVMDKCVSDLENDIGELKDGEERDKVKKAIEDLAVLIDKGVEIYSSIETPKEIKVLFPFEKDTAILPDNLLKMIEDKGNSNE